MTFLTKGEIMRLSQNSDKKMQEKVSVLREESKTGGLFDVSDLEQYVVSNEDTAKVFQRKKVFMEYIYYTLYDGNNMRDFAIILQKSKII